MVFSSLSLSVLLLLAILVRQHSSSDEVSNTVPVERLIVCTIVDPRNKEIVRDVKTLLRSISLFGGSLRKARLVVGWACPRDAPCIVDLSLARELQRYPAEIAFFPETDALTYARTTHKFSFFYVLHVHYTHSFDYLLWLDAGTLVLRDPLPLLPMHRLPGEIHCVPELYSYLRRFPALFSEYNSDANSDESDGNHGVDSDTSSGSSSQGSEMFVHPLLSTFVLAGEDERTPHGVCNTGVLLWDTHSLRRALSALPLPLPHPHNTHGAHDTHTVHTVIPPHMRCDRFADSLFFVFAVNAQGIDVRALPYSINYMAFMDTEIAELTDTHDVSIAHFIAETEFYCVSEVSYVVSNGERERVCRCVYANTRLAADSPLTKRLQEIAQSEHCSALAGDLSLPPSQTRRPMCELLWPPPHWRFLTHHAHTTHREIHVVVRCARAVRVQVRLDSANERSTHTHPHAHTHSDSHTHTDSPTVHIAANETSLISLTHFISQTERYLSQHTLRLFVHYRSACESASCEEDTQEEELRTEIVSVSRSQSARGELRMWRETPLQGHKPISLDTQLHLFSFAHTHVLTHSPHIQNVALFLCCDTVKGVLTTQRFLSEAHTHSYDDTHTASSDEPMLSHNKDGLLHLFVWRLPETLTLLHETLSESALRLFSDTCMSPSHTSTHADIDTQRNTQPRSRCVLWIADHNRAQDSNDNTNNNDNSYISTQKDDAEFLQLIDLVPAQSCRIVFIDAYPDPLSENTHSHSSNTSPPVGSHKEKRRRNRSLLQTLFEKTRRGGFLFGSEYALSSHSDSAFSHHAVWENTSHDATTPHTTTAVWSVRDFNRLRQEMLSFAVQSWALSVRHVLLFTHNEREDEFCADLSLRRCLPAWYIQKAV